MVKLKPSHLMKTVIGNYSHGRGEVQAANLSPDRDGITGISLPDVRRQSQSLPAEQKIITTDCLPLRVNPGCMPAEQEKPPLFVPTLQERFKTLVVPNINLLPVVQSCPL